MTQSVAISWPTFLIGMGALVAIAALDFTRLELRRRRGQR